jgi:predicted Fe-S protein YdhL (DUF1289 family)
MPPAAAPGAPQRDPVPSPCTQICTLDANDTCQGCGRTLDEIAAWSTLSDEGKRAVVAAARERMVGSGG